jgi:hypothetical protein
MDRDSRQTVGAICFFFLVLAIIRLVISLVLRARGENPADYMADAPTSLISVLVLGVVCFYFRRDLGDMLSRRSGPKDGEGSKSS